MIDTHCHLNFRAFKDDASEVIARAQAVGVSANDFSWQSVEYERTGSCNG